MSITVGGRQRSQVLAAVGPDRVLALSDHGRTTYVRTAVGWRLAGGRRPDDGPLVVDPGLIAGLDAAVAMADAIPA